MNYPCGDSVALYAKKDAEKIFLSAMGNTSGSPVNPYSVFGNLGNTGQPSN